MATDNTLDPLTYYRWKWQKFRADRRVQRMDYICKGIYRELLDECWVKGFVLSNVEDLADIIGCEEEVIEKYWHLLSKCLVLLESGKRLHKLASNGDEEGGKLKLISPSLNEERTKKDAERIGRAISGAIGGKAKSGKPKEASASKSLAKKEECHIEEKRKEREENRIEENIESVGSLEIYEELKNETHTPTQNGFTYSDSFPQTASEVEAHAFARLGKFKPFPERCAEFFDMWSACEWQDANQKQINWKQKLMYWLKDYDKNQPKEDGNKNTLDFLQKHGLTGEAQNAEPQQIY